MNQCASSKSTPKQQPVLRTKIPQKNNQKIIWTTAVGFIILISICVCGALIGGFIFKDTLLDLFRGQQEYGLVLNPSSEDGSVSGVYRGVGISSGNDITFSVSEDGYAVFEEDGSGNSLIVDGRENPFTTMQWSGVLFDGVGGLSGDEQEAMTALAESEMLAGISMIPLDAACLAEEQISPEQVAALLVPLQMHLKYNELERWNLVNDLISRSACDYSEEGQNFTVSFPVIYPTPADPIPVVPGYFPFDAEGAVDLQAANISGDKFACVDPLAGLNIPSNSARFFTLDVFGSDPIEDEWGPCKAKCRGACGPDCTHDNCKFSIEERCEKNQEGDNSGFFSLVYVYNCGLHPACVEHDACYDDCNRRHGCGSWAAAFCMHGMTLVSSPLEYFTDSYLSCDSATLLTEDPTNVKDWVRGYGPKTSWQIYEYHDKKLSYEYDPVTCPLKEDADQPGTTPEEGAAPTGQGNKVVATYAGTGEWGSVKREGKLKSTSSEIIISITEDGSVSGTLKMHEVFITYHNSEDDCSGHWEHWIDGTISGQLEGENGVITFTQNLLSKNFTNCPDYSPGYDASFPQLVDIRIVGNTLTGTSQTIAEDEYGVWNFTFIAEKQ